MTYQEYLELSYDEVRKLDPGDICERCKAGEIPVTEKDPQYSEWVMWWHPDNPATGWKSGCDAWRIHTLRAGREQELKDFESQFK